MNKITGEGRVDTAPQGMSRGTGVGLASVLLIVMTLAFTTFGILSLVSARADANTSRKMAENIKAYYGAEGRLQEQLSKLDEELSLGSAASPENGRWELIEEVREGQELRLRLEPATSGEAGRYRILGQELVNTGEWNPDTGFEIWDGGM